MTIRLRLIVLLALLGLLSAGSFLTLELIQDHEIDLSRERRQRELALKLRRAIADSSGSIWRFVRSYAARPSMAEFVEKRDPHWAERNLQDRLDVYRVDVVWVVAADGTLIYGFNRQTGAHVSRPPLELDQLRPLLKRPTAHEFFEPMNGGVLHQIYGMPIRAGEAAARGDEPTAWLFVARLWNQTAVDDLANAAQGRVVVTGPSHVPDVASPDELESWLPLQNHRGETIAGIDYHVIDASAGDAEAEWIELCLFVANAGGIVIVTALLLHLWIWRPFNVIRQGLKASDPAPLLQLLHRRDEFGQLARLAHESLRDREQLARTLEQQASLGRDLHDSVIQSLFGVGMAAARIEEHIVRDEPAVAKRLAREARTDLNRIIAELRGFIERTDPRAPEGNFADAVAQIARQLQGPEPQIALALEIDEPLVASYAPLCRGQILQFVREALSNAFRHGRPQHARVSWQPTSTGSTLLIEDDGQGFTATGTSGRGLGNLSERAIALGAKLQLDSQPGGGTRVRLTLRTPQQTP